MMNVQKTSVCVECLMILENENLRDFQNNPLCTDCAFRYYVGCVFCSLLIAKDEATMSESAAGSIESRCSNCLTESLIEKQSQLSFDADEKDISILVEEYLQLHAEEKSVKERLEAVKEKLKQIADGQSKSGATVTFESETGAVKCSYRTALKVVPEKIAALRERLDEKTFNRFFIEKISFDANKDWDNVLASETSNELKSQLEAAVKRSESATLTVVKKVS